MGDLKVDAAFNVLMADDVAVAAVGAPRVAAEPVAEEEAEGAEGEEGAAEEGEEAGQKDKQKEKE